MGCLTEKKGKETFRGKGILWRKGLFIQTWFIVPSSICYCMWACKHFPSAINCKRTQPSTYSRYVQCTMYNVHCTSKAGNHQSRSILIWKSCTTKAKLPPHWFRTDINLITRVMESTFFNYELFSFLERKVKPNII